MKWQGKEWKNETGHNFKKTLSFEKDPVNRSYRDDKRENSLL